jgi:SAM-dependent methyltransferase
VQQVTTANPGLSGGLLAHVEELPLVRRSILDAVSAFAMQLPPGTRVLDAGAGNAPYAELFAHCIYVTADWPQSVHDGATAADILASLEALPLADASFDAVLCTEVLEHVSQPDAVLAEFFRILTPGGRLCLTVPFVWPLHEEPFDYYRYTDHSLRHLLETAGFVNASIGPRSGYLATLAQIAEMARWQSFSPRPDQRSPRVRVSMFLVRGCAEGIRWLVRRHPALDHAVTGVSFPLGYRALASKPGAHPAG